VASRLAKTQVCGSCASLSKDPSTLLPVKSLRLAIKQPGTEAGLDEWRNHLLLKSQEPIQVAGLQSIRELAPFFGPFDTLLGKARVRRKRCKFMVWTKATWAAGSPNAKGFSTPVETFAPGGDSYDANGSSIQT